MEPLITTDQIYDAVEKGLIDLWNAIEPTIVSLICDNIVNMILVAIISAALFKVWRFFNFDASTKKERRVRRKIHDGVDAVTSLFDLFKNSK